MCCGVIPILFGWFLSVQSLHVLICIRKIFLGLVPAGKVFRNGKRGGKGRQGEDAQSVKYESIELCCSQKIKNHYKFKSFQVKL